MATSVQTPEVSELDAALDGTDPNLGVPEDNETNEPVPDDKGNIPEEGGGEPPDDGGSEPPKEDEPPVEEPPVVTDPPDRTGELQQIIRAQARDIHILKNQVSQLKERAQTPDAGDDDLDLDGKPVKPPGFEPSEVEQLQTELTDLGRTKGPMLDTLVNMMKYNEQYQDVEQVCTAANFATMFDMMGQELARQNKSDPVVETLRAEVSVWSMANPYEYMYGVIKKYHPSYANQNVTAAPPGGKNKPSKKETPEAPNSIAAMGGSDGGGDKSGWSAERIDNLPEDELSTVPEDVYQKYLRGELDK